MPNKALVCSLLDLGSTNLKSMIVFRSNIIVVQKLKKVNFDTALIQNQLNDGGDFEARFGTDFFNSTAAFLARTIANRLKFAS